jgi:hypothetical protein
VLHSTAPLAKAWDYRRVSQTLFRGLYMVHRR